LPERTKESVTPAKYKNPESSTVKSLKKSDSVDREPPITLAHIGAKSLSNLTIYTSPEPNVCWSSKLDSKIVPAPYQ
jgi:hypothetical protein